MFYKSKYFAPSERKPIRLGCIMMRLTAVLVCLVLVSFHLMTGLYARYSSTATGSDSARVAKFDVDVSGALEKSDIVCTAMPSGNSTYTVTIKNQSEVAVHYQLSVEITGNSTGVNHSFSEASGDLAVGATGDSELTFTVNWNDFTAGKTGSKAEVTLDFTVTVNVTQID